MSLKGKLYIAAVVALGAAALTHGFYIWTPDHIFRFCGYLVLATIASCLKVRLPGVTGTMSVLFLFLLAGIVELGLAQTLVIGAVCVLVQSYWHAKVRPRTVQLVFNVANIAIAIWVAHFVYYSVLVPVAFLQASFRLLISATALFIANTLPVAAVIALTEGKSLRQLWGHFYGWSFPYYLIGAAIVGTVRFSNRVLSWQSWLLILPVVYLIYRSYEVYLGQLEAERNQAEVQRKHAVEEHAHAEEVAALHARAMEALSSAMAANATLDAVIQASPMAILALNRDGIVTTWNAMAERIYGWSPEESVGRYLPFAGERSGEHVQTVIERILRGDFVSGMEMKQWRRDGSPFEAAVWGAPLRDASERVCGILITVADIGDRKRLEEQLRLSQKMEAVGRLAGGVAHDFNNLLTVINGYSAMLADSLKGDPYGASQAEEILGAGTRAAELVSQLLAFSRRQMIAPKPLEMNQLIKDVERMLRRVIGEHIQIRTVLDPKAGWIRADLNQMEGVLLNLATNAQDAMARGGILSIETASVDVSQDQQSLRELAPGSYVCLKVQDTGHGMAAETLEHLFEPFFTTKEKGKGTGLGLSSVYGAIEQNHGRIFVASEVGKGTSFSIYLPGIENPNPMETRPSPAANSYEGTETVLLVEDENSVRRMLREALCKSGYRVLEAENGLDAIQKWRNEIEDVDLLVTDIVMPVMNGLKLAEELRNRRPLLRTIYMSGHAEEMISRQTGPDSALDLLSKPFIPEVLVRRVREVLGEPSSPSVSGDVPATSRKRQRFIQTGS